MKNLNIWKIILLTAGVGAVLCLFGFFTGANTNGVYLSPTGLRLRSGEFILTKEDNLEEFQDIDIDVSSADVNFITASDYGIEINREEGDGLTYEIANGKLTIREDLRLNIGLFNIGGKSSYVNVYLPRDARLDSVKINQTSGSTDIEILECADFDFRQSSGDANISALISGQAAFDSTSGTIRLGEAKTDFLEIFATSGDFYAENIETNGTTARLTSGSVEISGRLLGDTKFDITSGDITLNIDGSERDYNRNFNATSGDIRVNGKDAGEGNMDIGAENGLDINMTSGNADVNFSR